MFLIFLKIQGITKSAKLIAKNDSEKLCLIFFSFQSLTELKKGPKPKTNPRNINKSRHRQKEAESIPKNNTQAHRKNCKAKPTKKMSKIREVMPRRCSANFNLGSKAKPSQGEPKKVKRQGEEGSLSACTCSIEMRRALDPKDLAKKR